VPGAADSALIVHGPAFDPTAAAAIATATRVGRILTDTSAEIGSALPSAAAATAPGRRSNGTAVPAFTLVLGRDYDRLVIPSTGQ
jgi:hypothetical protein